METYPCPSDESTSSSYLSSVIIKTLVSSWHWSLCCIIVWKMYFKCCCPVAGMSAKELNTYRNCQRTNTVPKAWVEHIQIQKPVCNGKMGWKYQLVKEFRLIVMMCRCYIMSILLYHPGGIVMVQNPWIPLSFLLWFCFWDLVPTFPTFISHQWHWSRQCNCKVHSWNIGWSTWVFQDPRYCNSHCHNRLAYEAYY